VHLTLRYRQRGLTAVEYAVAGGLVVAAVLGAMLAFGPTLLSAFGSMIASF
jgi:Flp pilus assembly pilin Flp